MDSMSSLLVLAHVLGLVLGVGGATAKLVLLLKSKSDHGFVPTYIAVARPLTRLIVTGLILLTLSGIGWLLLGYPFTPLLIAKLAMVVAIWALGPIIDKYAEPRFYRLAPKAGETATLEFVQIQQRYLLLEILATGLFYVIIVMWILG